MTNLKKFTQNKPAFTMIELVFVIIVIGILAALALPRVDRDLKQQASSSILSNIRYTQHLALMDYKHDFNNPKWQRRFWRIVFSTCSGGGKYYMIGSDDDMTGSTNATFNKNESALDPASGKPIFWKNTDSCSNGGDGTVSEEIFISKKYGITAVDATNCNGALHLGFDHLGRPHQGFGLSPSPDYSSYLSASCTFKFTMSDGDDFSITIEPETGYAFIVGQPSS